MLNKNNFAVALASAAAVFGLPSASLAQNVTSYGQSGGITAGTINMGDATQQTTSTPHATCNVTSYNQTGGETAAAVTILPDGRVIVDNSACDGARPATKHRATRHTPR